MKWLKSIFAGRPSVPSLQDSDFGRISYDGGDTGIWQTHDDIEIPENHAKLGFSSIPGTRDGPYPEARQFLLAKRKDLDSIWTKCEPTLLEVCTRWAFKGLRPPVRQQFQLTSLSMDEPIETPIKWSVGFESTGDFWTYVDITMEADAITGHSCDT